MAASIAQINSNLNNRLIGQRFNTTATTTLSDIKNFIFENLRTGISFMQIYDETGKFFGTGGNWFIIALAQDNVSSYLLAGNHWSGELKIIYTYNDSSSNKMLKIMNVSTTYSKDV